MTSVASLYYHSFSEYLGRRKKFLDFNTILLSPDKQELSLKPSFSFTLAAYTVSSPLWEKEEGSNYTYFLSDF